MKTVIAFIVFLIVLFGAISGLTSHNPYYQHDSLFFLLYLGGAVGCYLVYRQVDERSGFGQLAALGIVVFVVLAFVYAMFMFGSDNLCVMHFGSADPRCH